MDLIRKSDLRSTVLDFSYEVFLRHYLSKVQGDILELGVSVASTPILLDGVSNQQKVYSVDTNLEHLQTCMNFFPETKMHKYIYADDWNTTLELLQKHSFSFVFINHFPIIFQNDSFRSFKDLAEYILLSRADFFPKHGIFGIKCDGKYIFDDVCKTWVLYDPSIGAVSGTNLLPIRRKKPVYTYQTILVGSNRGREVDDLLF